MNDRYLFKGKRVDNGELVIGNLVFSEDSEDGWETIIIPTVESNMFIKGAPKGDLGFENWYKVDKDTICQCTGLVDKKGNLIWENDIMEAHLDDDYPEDVTRTKVIWDKNAWKTIESGSVDRVCLDDFDTEHFEIIGNIFDNPELLESEE